MCLICDGYSQEQAMGAVDMHIRIHGWHLALVEDDRPWAYTVGLSESFDVPELVVVGVKLGAAEKLIRLAVEVIMAGGELDRGLAQYGAETATVHERHLNGELFGTWVRRYDALPPPGSFLQVVPPADWFCDCHRDSCPRLDDPSQAPRGNRAARRRRR